MQTQKAIVSFGNGDARVVTDRPLPKLRDEYILVKTVAVALNPTDWKHVDSLATEGALIGCDYAGVVEEVGKGVTKPFKKGDRVAGFAHGCDKVQLENGAFADYIVAKGDIALKIPDQLSFEEASTLGVGLLTVGQGMYQAMKLPWPQQPSQEKEQILIYGASSATGTLAVQFARLSGLLPIAICSPRNFGFVKRLGAVEAFDYNDPEGAAKVHEYTKNSLRYAFDTISTPDTAKFCADALTIDPGARYGNILREKSPREDVEYTTTLAYTALGEYTEIRGNKLPAMPDHFEFAKSWMDRCQKLLEGGHFAVHPPKVGEGGLHGVLQGLQDMKEGKVSGNKLVYRVAETRSD